MLGAAAAAEAGDLFVLQLVSARLVWKERATVVELQAEEPGARLGFGVGLANPSPSPGPNPNPNPNLNLNPNPNPNPEQVHGWAASLW